MTKEYGSAKALDEALKLRNEARLSKAIVNSDIGQKIMQQHRVEITTLLNEIAGGKALPHEEYIEKNAQVAVLRKILNKWETQAANLKRYEAIYEQRGRERAERIRLEQQTK